jgi:hypothetical protein
LASGCIAGSGHHRCRAVARAFDRLLPCVLVGVINRPLRPTLAAGIIILGLWIVARAVRGSRNAHFASTAPPPDTISDDVYGRSRNPLYSGPTARSFS